MDEQRPRDALRTIAASALGSRHAPLVRVDREHEADLLAGISAQRLTGLAIEAEQHGELQLTSEGSEKLSARHLDQLALDLRLERLLIAAATVLDQRAIAYRALKGPLLAHTAYDDPSRRSFGDVDLLVPGRAFDAAIDALGSLGFVRRFVEPRPGFDARFSKGACLERADGLELDLHRTLAPGAFGVRLAHAELFSRPSRRFDLGGYPIAGLDPELAFTHACFHAALGNHPPRLVPLRDIVQLSVSGFDASAVTELAITARCESVFQRAVNLVDTELGIDLEGEFADWARAHRPSRFDRWALRGYAGDNRSYAGQVAASLGAMRSTRERVSYAAALAFPERDYVRARERSYARRFTRGLRVMQGSRHS